MNCFLRHKWTDWAVTEEGICWRYSGNDQRGRYLVQMRHCTKCGMTQINEKTAGPVLEYDVRQPLKRAEVRRKDGVA